MRNEEFEMFCAVVFVPIWFSMIVTYYIYMNNTSMLMIDVVFTSGMFWLLGISGVAFWIGETCLATGTFRRERNE